VIFARRLFGYAVIGLAIGAFLQRRRRVSIGNVGPENDSTGNDPHTLNWKDLMQLDYRSGRFRGDLQARILKEFRTQSFVVPLQGEERSCSEFLLVPYSGACIHAPPPPPNQIVHAHADFPQPIRLFDAIWAIGQLQLLSCSSPYGQTAFEMKIRDVRVLAKG